MNAWIAVSSQEKNINNFPEIWCFNNKASSGDLVFVYLTKKCSITGIKYICEVNEITDEIYECTSRNMTTRILKPLYALEAPITYEQLIKHPILNNMDGVFGRFQKTTLMITRYHIKSELLNFIAENNSKEIYEIPQIERFMTFISNGQENLSQ